jgi:hypothetical protein
VEGVLIDSDTRNDDGVMIGVEDTKTDPSLRQL